MRYKGYNILPVYCAGSDFTVTENNTIRNRRPKKADIEYYEAIEYGSDVWQFREFTITECKTAINNLNAIIGDSLCKK